MSELPSILIHQFEGTQIEFVVNQLSITLDYPKDFESPLFDYDLFDPFPKGIEGPNNVINAQSGQFIKSSEEIGIHKGNRTYKMTFSQPLSQSTIDTLQNNPQVQGSGWIFTVNDRTYYGQASIILLTHTPQSIETIERIAQKDQSVIKVLTDRFFLVQYRSDSEAYRHYERIRKTKPTWMHSIDYNLYTFHVNLIPTSAVTVEIQPILSPIAQQWAYQATHVENAHTNQKGSKDIRVAIFDTGIDNGHPDLLPISAPHIGYDFVADSRKTDPIQDDANAHGTKCAGIVAGYKKYDSGIDGVAKGVTIVDYRIGYVFDFGEFRIDLYDTICAFYQAAFVEQIDVINCSWGFDVGFDTLKQMIDNVWNNGRDGKGTLVVCAAGNSNKDIDGLHNKCFPANMKNVITVSAVDPELNPVLKNKYTWGSNYGTNVDLAAPGIELRSTSIRRAVASQTFGYTKNFNGTSAAAPMVTGCIGLMLSKNPNLTSHEIKAILTNSAILIPFSNGHHSRYGAGILDVEAILNNVN